MSEPDSAPRTLCEAFRRTAVLHSGARALGTFDGRVRVTWGEYLERVDRIAGALHTLGVRRGDTVGLMMVNRPEFHLCDTAALHLGATPFSIYNTSSVEQIEHLFADAGNEVVIAEPQFVPRLVEAGAKTVVSLTECPDPRALADLEAQVDPAFDVEACWRAVEPDDLATLIYTSGTTGPPKGVECTHAQLLAECEAFGQCFAVGANDVLLSFLPAAHIAERALSHYIQLCSGATVLSVADPRAVGKALPLVCPTVFLAVPSVWQRMRASIEMAMQANPMLAVSIEAKEPDALANVCRKLGLDWARLALTGAAPIAPETLEFFTALGVPIFEGWGMSEICGAGLVNLPGHNRVGTVGRPLPGSRVKLASDGELLFAGPMVMRGYRNRPEATAEVIDADGWLHTGDVATIDADGYVKIIDRKKEIIINAAGKNMSPANIETTVRAAVPLIGQVVAIGDARAYVTALIVLDPDAVAAWAARRGLDPSAAAAAAHPEVAAAVAAGVAAANLRLSRVEQVKRFRILPEFWAPGGEELTPTMKLRRRRIAEGYAGQIEELYAEPPGATVQNVLTEADR
jgi:long-subunit acyl-CoA synthetase (AMP-forming)